MTLILTGSTSLWKYKNTIQYNSASRVKDPDFYLFYLLCFVPYDRLVSLLWLSPIHSMYFSYSFWHCEGYCDVFSVSLIVTKMGLTCPELDQIQSAFLLSTFLSFDTQNLKIFIFRRLEMIFSSSYLET